MGLGSALSGLLLGTALVRSGGGYQFHWVVLSTCGAGIDRLGVDSGPSAHTTKSKETPWLTVNPKRMHYD